MALVAAAVPAPAQEGDRAVGGERANPSSRQDLAPAAAHRDLLARVIVDTRVATRRARPSPLDYLGMQVGRGWSWLMRKLVGAVEALPLPVSGRTVAAIGLVLVMATAVALVVRLIAMTRRRYSSGAAGGGPPPVPLDPVQAGPERSAAEWRSEVDRRLAAGRVREALEALWWWLARSLVGARAEASWTGGQLLAASRRTDLAGLVGRFDVLAYGPLRPAAVAVRELAAGLEARLGAGGAVAPVELSR